MKMTEEEITKIKGMIKDLRRKYNLTDSKYTDVDDRAYNQWIATHDYIPDIEEIDSVINEVRNKRGENL